MVKTLFGVGILIAVPVNFTFSVIRSCARNCIDIDNDDDSSFY